MMVEWPGRCSRCHEAIDEWSDAGLYDNRWIHKACFAESWQESRAKGVELAPLRAPTDRGSVLELPMLVFLLMFHFGLGALVAGWITLTQGGAAHQTGTVLVVVGLVTPLIGVAGVTVNILSRHRIELIRRSLDLQGGWKPGR